MKPIRMALMVAFLLPAAVRVANAQDPVDGPELMVFRTEMGDIAFALYPKQAPKSVAQIVNLVRLKLYDGTYFVHLEPGFYIQLSSWNDRREPATPEQQAAVLQLPLEAVMLQHLKGALTLAHGEDPNSSEMSFSILLADAPHLDGEYTVFGRVKYGWEVVRELVRIARVEKNFPRIEVVSAEIVAAATFDPATLRGPEPPKGSTSKKRPHWSSFGNPWRPTPPMRHAPSSWETSGVDPITVVLELFVIVLGISIGLVAGRSSKWIGSMGLMTVVLAFFSLMRTLGPMAQTIPWLAATLFCSMFSLIFLMTRFDAPVADEAARRIPNHPGTRSGEM